MNHRIVCLAVAATALLVDGSAHATAKASASITGLTVTLIDLNLSDGVTPWIAFAGTSFNVVSASGGSGGEINESVGIGALDPLYGYASDGLAWASATGTGSTPATITSATNLVGSLLASGQADGWNMNPALFEGTAVWNAYVWGPGAYAINTFTVSPNTIVQFSAIATTSATVSDFSYPNELSGNEWATSSIVLWVNGPGSNGAGSQDIYTSVRSEACNRYFDPMFPTNCFTLSDDRSETIDTSFMNATANSMDGEFIAFTSVTGGSNVAQAVPEPQIFMLLLTGLGVLSLRNRRQRHK